MVRPISPSVGGLCKRKPTCKTRFSAIGDHLFIAVQACVVKEDQVFNTGFMRDVAGNLWGQMPVLIWVFQIMYARRGFAEKQIRPLRGFSYAITIPSVAGIDEDFVLGLKAKGAGIDVSKAMVNRIGGQFVIANLSFLLIRIAHWVQFQNSQMRFFSLRIVRRVHRPEGVEIFRLFAAVHRGQYARCAVRANC